MASVANADPAVNKDTAAIEKRKDLTPEQQAFHSVRSLLASSEQQLAAALPKGIPVSYMMRVVLTAVQRTPALLECHPITLLGAVFQAAQLGLVPDGVLGQAYLVPYNNRDKRRKEVQFIPGYRGLVTLARRSGEISTIDADIVRQKDHFKYVRGINPVLEHIPSEEKDPGPIVKVYAFARLKDGGFQIKVMTTREVEAIKGRSAAVKAGKSSPWDSDPEWMFKKTALKQLCKLLPVSIETQRALALDDRAEVNLPQDLALLADESESPTPDPDGDVIDVEASVDVVDAELALLSEAQRAAVDRAFGALRMNRAQKLVQLRAFKGQPDKLLEVLQGMLDAEQAGGEPGSHQPEARSREMPSDATGSVGGSEPSASRQTSTPTASQASASTTRAQPRGKFDF